MIEAAMYIALGFCTAALIGLAILPAFYRRAARLTEQALRAVNPSSYVEIRAAQDQMRAKHAVDLQRVERQRDEEREKAAKYHMDASRLQAELETLQKQQKADKEEFDKQLASLSSDEKAVDLLSGEISTLKEKLAEAEKTLAESWTKLDEDNDRKPQRTVEKDNTDWIPAVDTMALATITGLEAEISTLKAKLSKYEPSVAGEVESERIISAKSRLADLEAQLVETESKYVAAQAEVTQLSLKLDAANRQGTDVSKELNEQLSRLSLENAQFQAELVGNKRTVDRLNGQIDKLRNDLSSTEELAVLRREFRQLVERVQTDTTKPVGSSKVKIKTAPVTKEPSSTSDDMRPKKRARKNVSGVIEKRSVIEGTSANGEAQPKSLDIASAAEALVSRVVASNRKTETAPQTTKSELETAVETTPTKRSRPTRAQQTKPKNKDVA